MKRNGAITGVAGIIVENVLSAGDALKVNEKTGWVIDKPGSHARSWVRHEGIVLSETALAEAVRLADTWSNTNRKTWSDSL